LAGLGAGLLLTLTGAYLVLYLMIGRPFAPSFGSPMFWVKGGYTLAFGLLGLAAAPVVTRPDGRIVWPLVFAGLLVLAALGIGALVWMQAEWAMPELMGETAMICPWLITLAGT